MKTTLILAALAGLGACAAAFAFGPPAGSAPPTVGNAVATLAGGEAMDAEQQARIDIGFASSPVAVDLEGKNPRLVGLGSYLVNIAGACIDCHTAPTYAPGGDPFLGQPMQINTANYLAGGKAFGPFTSRNLTPNLVNGLPGGRTLDDFMQAMREGHDFDCVPGGPVPGCPIMQVMPWPYHAQMNDNDLKAIYAYLGAIPHAEPASSGSSGGRP
ncbi:MAG TPA: hypothetical protein VFN09_04280 [Rhodanobacteraceae bacterium]|nr:hypothetical protein [Rhodanobacteraceae bacterium]